MTSNTDATVQALNAGWRNYLCEAMNLEPNKFQLAQGTLGLQTTDSSGLFRMADAVPPSSAVGYYDATSTNSRSNNYLLMLSALLPETSPIVLQSALGDFYASWITYKTTPANWAPGATLISVYNNWSNMSAVDPGMASRGAAAITAAQNSPLNIAYGNYFLSANKQNFVSTDGSTQSLYIYTPTSSAAKSAINTGGSVMIDFDSSRMNAHTSSTFAEAAADGFYEIFSGGVSGSFDQQNANAASSKFTIKGRIGSFATLACGPAGNWYSSAEVKRAYNGQNNANIWDPQASAGNWDSIFGQPNGALARYVSQLVLVSDYKITVTSTASYSESDRQEIQANASAGVWPFFSVNASATQKTTFNETDDSTLSVTQELEQGKIQIWGVTVENAGGQTS